MAIQNPTVYCSLDLEFTGFDPSKDQILEVAFVLFTLSDSGVAVQERWSSLFRPTVTVPEKVLGLTHLTMAQLEAAPNFADHAVWLQEKLQNVVFVGHNLTLDLKFLEAFGVSVSSAAVIDTLDLVQWLLPTYHSYNLENVARFLRVVHTDAHRALADCDATIGVLEKLLAHFRSFSPSTQKQLVEVLGRAFPALPALLLVSGPSAAIPMPASSFATEQAPSWPAVEAFPAVVRNSHGHQSAVAVAQAAVHSATDTTPLIVLPHVSAVMDAWQQGFGAPVFSAEQTVDLAKVAQFIAQAQTPSEVLFAAKLVVWQAINWQTQTHIDLNTSFAGHQYIAAIAAGETVSVRPAFGPLLTDYANAIALPLAVVTAATSVTVVDVVRLEQWLSHYGGQKWSWQRILTKLKGIFDPERVFPYEIPVSLATKTTVTDALAATDLFFGLLHLELKPWQHLGIAPVSEIAQNPFKLQKLEHAAHTLARHLLAVAREVPESGLEQAAGYIEGFFVEENDPVKWVDFGLRHTVLVSRQVELSLGALSDIVALVPATFVDCVGNDTALAYALTRLGQPVLPVIDWVTAAYTSLTPETVASSAVHALLEQLLIEGKAVIVLFSTLDAVKDFYDAHYEALGKVAQVWAQGYSGGQNKILRNFSATGRGLLLATAEFLARQHLAVPAHCLILDHVEQNLVHDPYTRAVVQRYEQNFPELIHVWHATMLEQLTHLLTGLERVVEVKN